MIQRKFKQKCFKTLLLILVLSLVGIGKAAEGKVLTSLERAEEAKEEKEEEVAEVKELTGELISFTPRGDPKFITIAVKKENTDYIFLIDENIKVVHKKNLNEIAIGDTVRVKYHVIIETSEEGNERSKRVAKVIKFIKPRLEHLELKGLRSK